MEEFLFKDLTISSDLLQGIEAMGFTTATQIQSRAILPLLEGKDVTGLSGTGTGKTAAYGIPLLEKIQDDGRKAQALVLCPTRELAMQISDELRKFSAFKRSIHLATLYGGHPFQIQFNQLHTANVIIGTPGRVMDHLERGTLSLEDMSTIVLDEADEMLNMGFFEDIEHILSQAPEKRQTILFSATMPPAILKATQKFQKDPVMVKVSSEKRVQTTISQLCYDVPRGKKPEAVNLLLRFYDPKRSIVFCNTKKMVDELVEYLNGQGFASEGLHGDMKQLQRTAVMRGYKQGKTRILVATDVAARGIDVEDVEAVFNFDIPLEREYYIHRVGRTGRAGKTGISHTFICDKTQRYKVRDIQRHTGQELEEKELPTPKEIRDKIALSHYQRFVTALEEQKEETLPVLSKLLEEGHDPEKIANMALQLVIGKETIHIPQMPIIKRVRPVERSEKYASNSVRVRLNLGRAHKVLPNHIVAAFVEETDLPAKRIGDIKITNDYSDVELSKEDALEVISLMEGKKIRNKTVSLTLLSGGIRDERSNFRKNRDFKNKPRRKSKRPNS